MRTDLVYYSIILQDLGASNAGYSQIPMPRKYRLFTGGMSGHDLNMYLVWHSNY